MSAYVLQVNHYPVEVHCTQSQNVGHAAAVSNHCFPVWLGNKVFFSSHCDNSSLELVELLSMKPGDILNLTPL